MAISIPYSFVPNTDILSAEVNANFSQIATLGLDKTGDTMTGTLSSRAVIPSTTDAYDLGSALLKFRNLYLSGTTTLNGRTYTWPSTETANYFLQTNGSGTLSFASIPTNGTVNGRLTFTTATPVTTGDVTSATVLYFTPFRGNYISLYDGSVWNLRSFSELSIAVPNTSNTLYDVFVYDNNGTATLELTAWTNDTTRATALTTQNGVLVKTGATTRRYVGSFRTTGSSGNSEDSAAKRYLWNYYNRVPRFLRVTDSTNTWAYNTATYRQANASSANQIDVVVGWAEVLIDVSVYAAVTNGDGVGVALRVAIGEDSTTAPATGTMFGPVNVNSNTGISVCPLYAHLRKYPAVGRHFYAWLELGAATNTTWYGDNGDLTTYNQGITGVIEG